MIPQIKEINFPDYATLHEATISLNEMGERIINTQVRISGDVVPEFDNWELEFKGERFILPIKEPQAAKDNTTINSLVDLTFYSWPIYQMKRYFFFETASVGAGTVIPDQYDARIGLNVVDFVDLFNRVLDYYFDGSIIMELYEGGGTQYSSERSFIDINKTYIWDVLQSVNKIYDLRWIIQYDSSLHLYRIKVGYPSETIDDHEFEYGYDGGLLRFERQVQDDNINNILLGRGGDKNLPYRYFKRRDENNPIWSPDPDAVPELQYIYFDRLREAGFRNYVQGWRTNPHRDTSWEPVQQYDAQRAATDWAYEKGHTDEKFNPVEFVKDDISIEKYGERWGALDNNDDIFPTIQGVENPAGNRLDEVVDVSDILTDDIYAMTEKEATVTNIEGVKSQYRTIGAYSDFTTDIRGGSFSVPENQTGRLEGFWFKEFVSDPGGTDSAVILDTNVSQIEVFDSSTDTSVPAGAIPSGQYYYVLHVRIENQNPVPVSGTFGINELKLTLSSVDDEAWKPTFDIWVKNIWGTSKEQGESDVQYSERVWMPILGDRFGNEAKVVFSDGFMSASQDYEFTIVEYPTYDTSKTINGVPSEWKITLRKSDAEFEATGKFIPSADGGKPAAGDHFFFIGIDLPWSYVYWAEQRLTNYKQSSLDRLSQINPTWVISLDKVRVHSLEEEDYGVMLADRIKTGSKIHAKDARFTSGQILTLYVQSITYRWEEPTEGNPYIVPDIEVVLSDTLAAVESPVKRLESELSVVKAEYAKISDVEQAVRNVASPMFLKKTGEPDYSSSPTKFGSAVSSANFRQGDIGGSGWGMYKDFNGKDVIEVDKIVAREELRVNSIVANQIEFRGGKEVLSAAKIECIQVEETDDGYVCHFDQKRGSVKNMFVVGDFAMGQIFNPDNTELRYYKRRVDAVDVDSITLSKTVVDGTGVPEPGDVIVQYGNDTDTSRQYIIIRDVIGGGYERMLSGLNSVSANGVEYYFSGMDANARSEEIQLRDSLGRQLFDSLSRPLIQVKNIAEPRWFVGDAQHYALWTKQGGLEIKGALNVSPSGDEFPNVVPRGDYNPTVRYFRGDLVTNQGSTYLCITSSASIIDIPPTNTTHWHPWAMKGDDGGSVVFADLSNEMDGIGLNASGQTASAVTLTTIASMHYGTTPVPLSSISFSGVPTGVTASGNVSTGEITFSIPSGTSIAAHNEITVELTGAHSGTTYTKTLVYTLAGIKDGEAGESATTYKINVSSNSVKVNSDRTSYSPSRYVTARTQRKVGDGPYQDFTASQFGYLIDQQYTDPSPTWHALSQGGSIDMAMVANYVQILFYASIGGSTVLVDVETIPLIKDGQPGEPGTSGTSRLPQYAKTIAASVQPTTWYFSRADIMATPEDYVWERLVESTDGQTWTVVPNTTTIIYVPEDYLEMKNDTAKNLGYASWDEFAAQAVAKTTIIQGGYLNTSIIDTDLLLAKRVQTSDPNLGKKRVIVDNDEVTIFDDSNMVVAGMSGIYVPSIASFVSSGSSQSSIGLGLVSTSLTGSTQTGLISAVSPNDVLLEPDVSDPAFKITGSGLFKLSGQLSSSIQVRSTSGVSSVDYARFQVDLFLSTSSSQNTRSYYLGTFYDDSASGGMRTQPFSVNIEGGTYYLWGSCRMDATVTMSASSASATVDIYISRASGTTINAVPLSELLRLFANGIGYKYTPAEYFALIRTGASKAASGHLQLEMMSQGVGMQMRDGYLQGTRDSGASWNEIIPVKFSCRINSSSNTQATIAKYTSGGRTVSVSHSSAGVYTITISGGNLSTNDIAIATVNPSNASDKRGATARILGSTQIEVHVYGTGSTFENDNFSVMVLGV